MMMLKLTQLQIYVISFDLIVASEILEKDLSDGNLFRKILLVYMTMLKVNGFTEMNLMNQKFLNI